MVFFLFVLGGGQDKQPGQLAPGGEDNRGGGRYPGISSPPGSKLSRGGGGVAR